MSLMLGSWRMLPNVSPKTADQNVSRTDSDSSRQWSKHLDITLLYMMLSCAHIFIYFFIIECIWTIFFIFIVIFATFLLMCSSAFFRCFMLNSRAYRCNIITEGFFFILSFFILYILSFCLVRLRTFRLVHGLVRCTH